jgi:hypothetical protein
MPVSRLPRPNVPTAIELAVVLRQLGGFDVAAMVAAAKKERRLGAQRDSSLFVLACDLGVLVDTLELHHRPSLVNRDKIFSCGIQVGYDPPANSADHLIYLAADDHDIETRVRGLHGQHSDLGIARKNKRIARNRDPKRRRVKIKSKGFQKGPKRKIQSRGFR